MRDRFEHAAEEFLQAMGREYYENGAGLKDSLDIVPLYEKYGWLFGRETVDELLKRHDPEGKELASFAADGYLDESVSVLSEQITNSMTRATVEWHEERIPYRRASVVLANEPDSSKRHELEQLIHAKTEDQNINRMERLQRLHAKARDLGFDSYLSMYDKLKGIHLDWLLKQMDNLLVRTEDVYVSELHHYLDQLGVKPEEATPADLAFLFRSPEYDKLFPEDRLVPALTKTLSGMGIELDNQSRHGCTSSQISQSLLCASTGT